MIRRTLRCAALVALSLTGGCAAPQHEPRSATLGTSPSVSARESSAVPPAATASAAEATSSPAPEPRATQAAAPKSGRVPVNGVDYYYEIHGAGEPLLLLHGGLGSIDMFGPVLTQLAATRQVIAVDLHGHGRTSLGDLVRAGRRTQGGRTKAAWRKSISL